MHIGCLHLPRYGEYTKNKGLGTCFTLTNLERAQPHNYVVKIMVNKMHWEKYGPLEESTCIQIYHHGITQKMVVEARKSKGEENKQF